MSNFATPVKAKQTIQPTKVAIPTSIGSPLAPGQIPKPNITDDLFVDKFDDKEFVERLTKKLVFLQQTETPQNGQKHNFNPEPFMKVFAMSMDMLQKMSEKTERRILTLLEDCRDVQTTHQENLAQLNELYEDTFRHFHLLDKRINNVGNTAVRMGEKLESVDTQRERALESKQLIECFLDLNSDKSPDLSDDARLLKYFFNQKYNNEHYRIKTSINNIELFEDPRVQKLYEKAILAKKLASIAKEFFNNSVLDIDQLQRMQKGKKAIEAICFQLEKKILGEFDEAAKDKDYEKMKECARIMFEFNGGDLCVTSYIDRIQMSVSQDEVLAVDTSKINIDQPGKSDKRLVEFFDSVTRTFKDEYAIICSVFPSPAVVMKQLILKIFDKRISKFLKKILENDKQMESLLYLRTLYSSYKNVLTLVEGLKEYEIYELNFENLIDQMFLAYKSEYIVAEKESLLSIYQQELEENKQENTQDPMATFISLEMIINFMHASEEAVHRCVLLSPKADTPHNLVLIFTVLLRSLGKEYVDPILERAVHVLPVACVSTTYKRTLELITQFFEMVYFVNQMVVFVQKHYHVDIYPHLSSAPNECTTCETDKRFFVGKLEQKIEVGLDKSLSALTSCVDKCLQNQKKNDFKVKEGELPSNSVTQTCADVIALCKQICKNIFEKNLDGKNYNVILEEFGNRVFKLLMTHYKKFKVSEGMGGIKLVRDVTELRDFSKIFNSDSVLENFELLKEMARIHVVTPESLKTIQNETRLSKLDKQEFITYVKLRGDFKPVWIGKYI